MLSKADNWATCSVSGAVRHRALVAAPGQPNSGTLSSPRPQFLASRQDYSVYRRDRGIICLACLQANFISQQLRQFSYAQISLMSYEILDGNFCEL